jgi:hypothetical protein
MRRTAADVARGSTGSPSGDGEEIDAPSRLPHRALKVGHVASRGAHVAGAGPQFPDKTLADNIEQCLAVGGLQTTITCRIGIAGVQVPNQFGVFLNDDPQSEVRGRDHATLFKLKSAAGQRRWQKDGQGLLRGPGVRFLRTTTFIWG